MPFVHRRSRRPGEAPTASAAPPKKVIRRPARVKLERPMRPLPEKYARERFSADQMLREAHHPASHVARANREMLVTRRDHVVVAPPAIRPHARPARRALDLPCARAKQLAAFPLATETRYKRARVEMSRHAPFSYRLIASTHRLLGGPVRSGAAPRRSQNRWRGSRGPGDTPVKSSSSVP